jgi:hypothetical protein
MTNGPARCVRSLRALSMSLLIYNMTHRGGMLVDFKKMIKMTVMIIMPYMLMIQHLGSAEWLCLNLRD